MPKALILTAEGFEDIEVYYPYYRLQEAGYIVDLATPKGKEVKGKIGYVVKPSVAIEDVEPDNYDVLVLPGGKGPERIRLYSREKAAKIVRHFVVNGKPVAAICHGPQLLITAGVIKGRRLTSYPGIRDDIEAAGGFWVDEPVVVDENIVTSRVPSDIPLWFREFLRLAEKYLKNKDIGV